MRIFAGWALSMLLAVGIAVAIVFGFDVKSEVVGAAIGLGLGLPAGLIGLNAGLAWDARHRATPKGRAT